MIENLNLWKMARVLTKLISQSEMPSIKVHNTVIIEVTEKLEAFPGVVYSKPNWGSGNRRRNEKLYTTRDH